MPKGIYPRNPNSKSCGPRKFPREDDQKISQLYSKGMTQLELAEMFGVGKRTILRSLRRTNTSTDGRKGSPGSKNPAWKGGRIVDKNGYVLVHRPHHPKANYGGYIREHRLVMEEILGRPMTRREVIHHKDGNHANNSPDNLVLFSDNGSHLGVELLGKIPKWTEEGLKKLAARKAPVMKGIPRPPTGTGVRQSRKKMIRQFLRETSELQDIGPVAMLPQLPTFRRREKKQTR
uniref:Putative homing endonuclease n=1 Tax=viral metagenome TaxID=1070528 RepID=A0A6M3IL38_9ZZZZ